MAEIDKIVEQLSKLTVMEAGDLAKKLEDVWDIKYSAQAAVTSPSTSGIEPDKEEEKSEYDVVLESYGEKKINVIKEVKTITGLNLKEAKELVESAPQAIKKAVPKAEAEELKSRLEVIGAKISLG
jgi:large subunit ribosomal protein L7/L12